MATEIGKLILLLLKIEISINHLMMLLPLLFPIKQFLYDVTSLHYFCISLNLDLIHPSESDCGKI